MTPIRPHLFQAFYAWIIENDGVPHITVNANYPGTEVPHAYCHNGIIRLNIGMVAAHQLTIDSDWITFSARFNRVSQNIAIPMGAVLGMDCKELNVTVPFEIEERYAKELGLVLSTNEAELVKSTESDNPDLVIGFDPAADKPDVSVQVQSARPERRKPHLTLVK